MTGRHAHQKREPAERGRQTLWQKPWQNMRATRETELLQSFPIHEVANRLGGTAPRWR